MILPEEVELFEPFGQLVGSEFGGGVFEFFEGSGIGTGVGLVDTEDFAKKSQNNTFIGWNDFQGIRLAAKTITGETPDYDISETDWTLRVDATLGPVNVHLLDVSILKRYYHRIKKIDSSPNVVSILAFGDDLIDGAISVTLSSQWGECSLFNSGPGYWDNMGSGAVLDLSDFEGGASPTVIEIPTGDIDGVNVDFSTLESFTSITVYLNGLRLRGDGNDYTVSGVNAFALTYAPLTGDYLEVEYITSDEIPEPPSSGVRYVTDPGPPISVSLQIKNSSDVWETIWTESAST